MLSSSLNTCDWKQLEFSPFLPDVNAVFKETGVSLYWSYYILDICLLTLHVPDAPVQSWNGLQDVCS